jgi:putative tryptophan/tyrosine transport system substrate-binding protein
MSRKIPLLAICLLIVGALIFTKWRASSQNDGSLTIGILQTATHPALDQSREGFEQEMNQLYNGNIHFVVQNAEGSLAQAQSIAESFHAQKKINAIYAIATPALQAAARVEKSKPIFIAAVSYPDSLGVLSPGTNVSGVSGRVNTTAQVEMIRTLLPDVKNVSIIYSPGDHNSQQMVKEMESALTANGLTPYTFGINSESEIAQTVALAARKGNLILIPTDNLLASAISLVSKESLKRKIPLITSDLTLVEKGAFAAQGINYFNSGKEAAKQAYRVLSLGESPEAVGIKEPTDSEIFVNADVLKALEIKIPESMQAHVKIIEGKNHAP